MIRRGLVLNENIVVKCMQLYESKCTRHSNMVIGNTMAGKTTTWEILQEALNESYKKEFAERDKAGQNTTEKDKPYKYKPVKVQILNPKAVSLQELYGYEMKDGSNTVWKDGVLARVLKDMCKADDAIENRWMILDGPVDTLWIETMNSVMDDSKLLTLDSGDRIKLTTNVRLLFECENLNVASPATVSRAGMIYLDIEELHWRDSLIESWIRKKKVDFGEDYAEKLKDCVHSHLQKVMDVKKTCKELVVTSDSALIRSFTRLYDCLMVNFPYGKNEERDTYLNYIEKWFIFAMIWSVGCTVEGGEEGRLKIENILRDGAPTGIPMTGTVYDYFIDLERKDFKLWSDKISGDQKGLFKDKKFHEIQVETIDSKRNRYVVEALLKNEKIEILLIGRSGVGKTSMVENILRSIDTN